MDLIEKEEELYKLLGTCQACHALSNLLFYHKVEPISERMLEYVTKRYKTIPSKAFEYAEKIFGDGDLVSIINRFKEPLKVIEYLDKTRIKNTQILYQSEGFARMIQASCDYCFGLFIEMYQVIDSQPRDEALKKLQGFGYTRDRAGSVARRMIQDVLQGQ